MTPQYQHRLIGLAISGGFGLLVSSCSPPPVKPSAHAVTDTPVAAAARIAQIDFDSDAAFARCIPPACPTRTPKTLATGNSNQRIDGTHLPAHGQAIIPDSIVNTSARPPESPRTITIPFAFASATLGPAAQARLDQATADIITAHSVTITGRTDSTGPQAANETLAWARAHAVRDYLRRSHPRLASALIVSAQGACCYIASNDNASDRALNRRVEVVIRGEDRP